MTRADCRTLSWTGVGVVVCVEWGVDVGGSWRGWWWCGGGECVYCCGGAAVGGEGSAAIRGLGFRLKRETKLSQ